MTPQALRRQIANLKGEDRHEFYSMICFQVGATTGQADGNLSIQQIMLVLNASHRQRLKALRWAKRK